MSIVDEVIYLKDELGWTWKKIGENFGVTKDDVRSKYRRAKGTHTTKQRFEKAAEQVEQFSTLKHSTGGQVTRIAFPTDEHFPFQDDRARSIALQIVQDFDPHVRITGSDGVDFYAISAYNKNPNRANRLQEEIDAFLVGQREWLSAAPNAMNVFIPGNHEDRLNRWLWRHPEIHTLRAMQMTSLLELNSINVHHKVDEIIFDDVLSIRHGDLARAHSGTNARAELLKDGFAISVMTGHSHRAGTFFKTTKRGVVQAHECFCLCDLSAEYAKRPDWQQGIALATVFNDHVYVELIPIVTSHGRRYTYWRDKSYWE